MSGTDLVHHLSWEMKGSGGRKGHRERKREREKERKREREKKRKREHAGHSVRRETSPIIVMVLPTPCRSP